MKRKARFIIPFLVLVLIFSFGLFTSCRAEEIIEEEIKEEAKTLKEVPLENKEKVEETTEVIKEVEEDDIKTESDFRTKQPTINSFSDSKGNIQRQSEVNDAQESESSGDFTISPGEKIDFFINISNGEKLLFKFGYLVCNSEDSKYQLIQNWSKSNKCNWTVPTDIPEGTLILVFGQIKNNDGIELAGSKEIEFCDYSSILGYFTPININIE